MADPVINLDDLEYETQQHGDTFEARFAAVGRLIGARKLGYRVAVVPAGKRAWPFHAHFANEEMFFVLEGRGRLRYGEREYALRAGDFVAAPPCGVAHQIINDSEEVLRYLCVSTMEQPEIVRYPDSGKFGALAGAAPGGAKSQRTFHHFAHEVGAVSYWDGES